MLLVPPPVLSGVTVAENTRQTTFVWSQAESSAPVSANQVSIKVTELFDATWTDFSVPVKNTLQTKEEVERTGVPCDPGWCPV